jgi:hypothetical protein
MSVKFPTPYKNNNDNNIRGIIAIALICIFALAFFASLVYGMITGDFNVIEKVSFILNGLMMVLLGRYMPRMK